MFFLHKADAPEASVVKVLALGQQVNPVAAEKPSSHVYVVVNGRRSNTLLGIGNSDETLIQKEDSVVQAYRCLSVKARTLVGHWPKRYAAHWETSRLSRLASTPSGEPHHDASRQTVTVTHRQRERNHNKSLTKTLTLATPPECIKGNLRLKIGTKPHVRRNELRRGSTQQQRRREGTEKKKNKLSNGYRCERLRQNKNSSFLPRGQSLYCREKGREERERKRKRERERERREKRKEKKRERERERRETEKEEEREIKSEKREEKRKEKREREEREKECEREREREEEKEKRERQKKEREREEKERDKREREREKRQ
ncbi:hypothetical protein WMY93_034240 [Mugilogobius chulae]|uniref:Uncharacterized protein n=1 Tax=Mugilogobius chulae TaxID=88201 RepID=A0AAW0MK59_9GOBI